MGGNLIAPTLQDPAMTYVGLVADRSHCTGFSDEELFRGGVPQVADWLRAWRACRSPTSFHAAQQQGVTENFTHGGRQSGGVERRAFRSMVEIMAEVVRADTRSLLRNAKSISIGLDDRGAYRLSRLKCDRQQPDGSTEGVCKVLGVLSRGGCAKPGHVGGCR